MCSSDLLVLIAATEFVPLALAVSSRVVQLISGTWKECAISLSTVSSTDIPPGNDELESYVQILQQQAPVELPFSKSHLVRKYSSHVDVPLGKQLKHLRCKAKFFLIMWNPGDQKRRLWAQLRLDNLINEAPDFVVVVTGLNSYQLSLHDRAELLEQAVQGIGYRETALEISNDGKEFNFICASWNSKLQAHLIPVGMRRLQTIEMLRVTRQEMYDNQEYLPVSIHSKDFDVIEAADFDECNIYSMGQNLGLTPPVCLLLELAKFRNFTFMYHEDEDEMLSAGRLGRIKDVPDLINEIVLTAYTVPYKLLVVLDKEFKIGRAHV